MKKLMKGNEAIAEAAIQAGCRFFFGYPITPQNQIPEYMSKRMPQVNGCFLQAESEVAAINMVYGAGGAGARVMTSSSSPGISLKQEGISYLVGAEVPCVIVNMVRGGPGLGGIQPAQSDYYQATRGGGHGDYRLCVLAPGSVQEAVDLTQDAFDIADRYRNPVLVMGDGLIGQMMEPVDMTRAEGRKPAADLPDKRWAADGHAPTAERPRAVVNSLFIDPQALENHNLHLKAKYDLMEKAECRWQEELLSDAEIVLVAYGTTSRIARSAMRRCRERGIKVGMLRPITLWPFPTEALQKTLATAKHYLVLEMSMGQMVDDVRLTLNGARPVTFFGRTGGMVPTVGEMVQQIEALAGVAPIPAQACYIDAQKALNDSARKADEVIKAMDDKFREIGEKVNEAVNSPEVKQKAAEVAGKVGEAFSAAGQKLGEAGQKVNEALNDPDLREKAEGVVQKVNEAVGALGQKLGEMGQRVNDALHDPALQQKAEEAANKAGEAFSAIGHKIGDALGMTDKAASDAAGSAETAADAAAQTAEQAVETAAEAVETAVEAAQTVADEAEAAVDADADEAEFTVEATQDAAEESAQSADDDLDQKAEEAFGELNDAMEEMNRKLGEASRRLTEKIEQADFGTKPEDLSQKAVEAAKNTAEAAKKGLSGLWGAIGKAFDTVKRDLGGKDGGQNGKEGDA
jgi:2-oxoglutarate ferredoxin oxidoreductase subunit alpha